MPFFFLVVDSWVLSAGGAGVVLLTVGAFGSAVLLSAGALALLSEEDGAVFVELAGG